MHALRRWTVLSHGRAEDRWAWSGIPASLAAGLTRHDKDVKRISADLPAALERIGPGLARRIPGYTVHGSDAAWLVAARDFRLRWSAAVKGDVVVALGSTFGLGNRSQARVRVTYEDMTVAQAPFPADRAKRRWVARQRLLYSVADLCCATTPWVAKSIEADYGVPPSKICVTGLGANIVCRPKPKDWGVPRILWIGVDWERKGGDLLVEAFRRAAIPNATLDLVGRHPDVNLPGVRGHGLIRDENRLRRFYENATLFVLPSRFDPSPIVFLEAASAGTPSVGTATAGLPYNVGSSGIVVPPGDTEALVRALVEMTRPEIASRYSRNAVAFARQHSWEAVAGRMISAVEACVQRSARSSSRQPEPELPMSWR